jgi:hypothetical protein
MKTNSDYMTANDARMAIYDLTGVYGWETIAREMISRMSGDEARSFVEDFTDLYSSDVDQDEDAN